MLKPLALIYPGTKMIIIFLLWLSFSSCSSSRSLVGSNTDPDVWHVDFGLKPDYAILNFPENRLYLTIVPQTLEINAGVGHLTYRDVDLNRILAVREDLLESEYVMWVEVHH